MEHKTRKQQAKDAMARAAIDPSEFGVKVLSDEEIRKLYPNATINRAPWDQSKKDAVQRRNMKARTKRSKKELAPYPGVD